MEKVNFIPNQWAYKRDGKVTSLPDDPSFFFACKSAGMNWIEEKNAWYFLTEEEKRERRAKIEELSEADVDLFLMWPVYNEK